MNNLEDIITDSVNDATIDVTPEPVESSTPDVSASDSTPAVETPSESPAEDTSNVSSPAEDTSVAAPGAQTGDIQDEFEKLVGVPQAGVGGRENRIPYSRVKKITEKAVTDLAEAVVGRKLLGNEKAADVVKAHVAQLPELVNKVTDYEARLNSVGQFENVMASDPQRFLTMLAKLPAYKEFFDFVEKAATGVQQGQVAAPTQAAHDAAAAQVQAAHAAATDGMPGPDEELTDGSKVYSEQGLKNLLAWHSQQTEQRVAKQFEARYKPIEQDWNERRRIEATLPIVRQQIAEAKTWPLFNENEEAITAALAADQRLSLQGAYSKVVFPKLMAERNATRQGVLQEIRNAPTSTSVPARVTSKPAPVGGVTGPRNLEDIIKEQMEGLKR